MLKSTKNWIESSEYDIKTAHAMLKTGRYIYVIFMCHLSLEKMLKAIINESTKKMPPRTHDLVYLVDLAKIKVPGKYNAFIANLSSLCVPTRYPEDLRNMSIQYNKENANNYYKTTKELIKWLKKNKQLGK